MLTNIKPLIVVLGLSLFLLVLAKPICLRFMSAADFERRRNLWVALTVIGFVSPSFWLFVLFAAPLLYFCGKKDSNPAALFLLMLHVIPQVNIPIPTIVINSLFDLSNYRLLSLVVLLPAVLRYSSRSQGMEWVRFKRIDGLVLMFAIFQLVLFIPYEHFTNTMRRSFLFLVDYGLIYLVFSRASTEQRRIVDMMASFVLAATLMALVGIFEGSRTWLLYTGINQAWGDPNVFSWLLRDDGLRVQAATGHAISLGYILDLAIGFFLCLQIGLKNKYYKFSVFFILALALYLTISRSPWLTAVAIYFFYNLISAKAGSNTFLKLSALSVAAALFLVSPFGQPIAEKLPFIGTIAGDTVEYREQLFDISWQLIQQNPYFGSPNVLSQMELLRQGQGIIDLVNVYAATALFFGGVGLLIFLLPFAVGVVGAVLCARRAVRNGHPIAPVAAAVAACMIGTLFLFGAVSYAYCIPVMYWILTGLGAALATKRFAGAPARENLIQSGEISRALTARRRAA